MSEEYMINKLKIYNERINEAVRNKLSLEVNVEFDEYSTLKKALFTKHERRYLSKEIFDVLDYLKHNKIDGSILAESWSGFSQKDTKSIDNLLKVLDIVYNQILSHNKKENHYSYKVVQIMSFIENIKDYLSSQIIIVNGDGATGKTHLLTRLTEELLNEDYPVITMYGHTISKLSETIDSMKKWIDEKNPITKMSEFANEIDETGLIIVDAINEARYFNKEDIINDLTKIISGTNVRLIISYRNGDLVESTEEILKNYPKISLYGFRDELEAAIIFSEYYDIDINEILAIEFNRNPLMLRIFCDLFKSKKKSKGIRGTRAATFYYESYFKKIIRKIFKEKNVTKSDGSVFPQIQIWNIIAKDIAKIMVDTSRNFVTENEAEAIIDSCNLNIASKDLLFNFTIHNAMERFIIDYKSNEIGYRFSFQKISDFLIVRYLLNSKPDNISWSEYFSQTEMIKYLNSHPTLLETLVEDAPPRCENNELFDIINTTHFDNFVNIYVRGLKYRSLHSLTNDVKAKKNTILSFISTSEKSLNYNIWFDMLFSVMIVSFHPLNFINYTSEFLAKFSTHDRDLFLYNISDYHYDFRSKMLSLLKIPYYSKLDRHPDLFIANLVVCYFWMLSMSDRELRDKSTKALTMIINHKFDFIRTLLNTHEKIDDDYITERVLSILYSIISIDNNLDKVKFIYDYCKLKYSKSLVSNFKIKYYLNLISNTAKLNNVIDDSYELIKSEPLFITLQPKLYEESLKFGLKYSNVHASLLYDFGDFSRYVVNSTIMHFDYYSLEFENTVISEFKLFYNPLPPNKKSSLITLLDLDKLENPTIEDFCNRFKNGIEKNYQIRDEVLSNFNSEEKELVDYFSRQFSSIKNRRLSFDTINSTLANIMLDIGYDKEIEESDQKNSYKFRYYSRHDHKIERLGKKYQWIAYFRLLGICSDNLHLRDDYYDNIRLFSIDIDPTQFMHNKKEIFEFLFSFDKRVQSYKPYWEKNDFLTNFDNKSLIHNYFDLEYKGDHFTPLYISTSIYNSTRDHETYFRLYSFKKNRMNSKIPLTKPDELSCYNHISNPYEFHLVEFIMGEDEKRYEKECLHDDFTNLVKSCHVESEYDYSNIDITADNKNRTYYSTIYEIIKKLDLKYDYAGIFFDSNNKVGAIQSPFDADVSYLYIRTDLLNQLYDEIIFAIYSEKRVKSIDNKYVPIDIGSEYDAIYLLNNNKLKQLVLNKRPYIPMRG